MQLLAHLKEQGLALLLVLHDLNLIARLADEVILLAPQLNGTGTAAVSTVVAHGSPKSVMTEENLAKVFSIKVSIVRDPVSGSLTYTPISCIKPAAHQD